MDGTQPRYSRTTTGASLGDVGAATTDFGELFRGHPADGRLGKPQWPHFQAAWGIGVLAAFACGGFSQALLKTGHLLSLGTQWPSVCIKAVASGNHSAGEATPVVPRLA